MPSSIGATTYKHKSTGSVSTAWLYSLTIRVIYKGLSLGKRVPTWESFYNFVCAFFSLAIPRCVQG